jgi:hypothetical protein
MIEGQSQHETEKPRIDLVKKKPEPDWQALAEQERIEKERRRKERAVKEETIREIAQKTRRNKCGLSSIAFWSMVYALFQVKHGINIPAMYGRKTRSNWEEAVLDGHGANLLECVQEFQQQEQAA